MVLGLSGPMAAGKNLAAEILEGKGWASVDADLLVHEVIEDKKDEIVAAFSSEAETLGLSLLNSDGSVNRRAVGQVIFGHPELVARQEGIVYPGVNERIDAFLEENRRAGRNCLINATLLYKVPSIYKVDALLYVDAPLLVRLLRARRRDGLPVRQILARFKSQGHLFSKYRKTTADIMRVWNTGSREKLERKIESFLSSCRPRG
ncbi:MAG: dephospho-CoA kinase [Treponema sp.]|nr:dephospho-CoA kinase [Treponema sp.]MCR5621480.1 dephospho-CoA kinase [Treponema sp.]